jgi:hypothetical protein
MESNLIDKQEKFLTGENTNENTNKIKENEEEYIVNINNINKNDEINNNNNTNNFNFKNFNLFDNINKLNSNIDIETNGISTSKYNFFNFIPIILFEQFSKMANCYFLMIAIMQVN